MNLPVPESVENFWAS